MDESKLYCPDVTEPDEMFQCLSKYVNTKHNKFSKECKNVVKGYSTCASQHSEVDTKPSPPNPNPNPNDDKKDEDKKNPPKGPGEENNSNDGNNNNNNNNGPGDNPPVKPGPPQTRRKLQKTKPEPKPKPSPDQQRPCWARGENYDDQSGDNLDLQNQDQSISSSSSIENSIGTSASSTGKIYLFYSLYIYSILFYCILFN